MNIPLIRFNNFLDLLQKDLEVAKATENPAQKLMDLDTRSILFRLEALAKIFSAVYDKKKLDKIQTVFKDLEDRLGSIDYYQAFYRQLSGNAIITPEILSYINQRGNENLASLNQVLENENWFNIEVPRTQMIRERLESIDWKNEEKNIRLIENYYQKSIKKIVDFYNQYGNPKFTLIEDQVHELRRMLRWLSIYPQAYFGAIQLTNSTNKDFSRLEKYFTDDIINSPYNTFPEVGNCSYILLLEKKCFLALSWMIKQIGILKDQGLLIYMVAEALQHLKGYDEETALEESEKLINNPQNTGQYVLNNASEISQDFFKEKVLENLVVDVRRIKEKKK